jgi:hypothetical protein
MTCYFKMKDASDIIRLPLQKAKTRNYFHISNLLGQMLESARYSGPEVPPYPFIGNESGRVTGQQVKRSSLVEGFYENPHPLHPMGWVAIDDQKPSAPRVGCQAFDKVDGLFFSESSFHHQEPRHAPRAASRDHFESKPRACGPHNRVLSLRSPCGSRVIVQPDSDCVSGKDFRFAGGSFELVGREFLFERTGNCLWILLMRLRLRASGSGTKLVEKTAYGGLAGCDIVPFLDDRGRDLMTPPCENDFELEKIANCDRDINALDQLPIKVGLVSATLGNLHSNQSSLLMVRQPVVNPGPTEVDDPSNNLRTLGTAHRANSTLFQLGKLQISQFSDFRCSYVITAA